MNQISWTDISLTTDLSMCKPVPEDNWAQTYYVPILKEEVSYIKEFTTDPVELACAEAFRQYISISRQPLKGEIKNLLAGIHSPSLLLCVARQVVKMERTRAANQRINFLDYDLYRVEWCLTRHLLPKVAKIAIRQNARKNLLRLVLATSSARDLI